MSAIPSSIPTATAGGTSGAATVNSFNSLTPSDFIQMMVTQLQNQDPLDPTNSQDILSQMSSIGQLQSSDSLQSTLSAMSLQSQISSASSLIGKTVAGNDSTSQSTVGVVQSISISQTPAAQSATGVATTNVTLNLASGDTMPLANVTAIAQPAAAAATTGATTTTPYGVTAPGNPAPAVPAAVIAPAPAEQATAAALQSISNGTTNTADNLATNALGSVLSSTSY